MTVRINSFPSWYYPWLKWTFSGLPEDEYDKNVSFCLDMFGYSYYISLIISPLPGMLISLMQKCTNGPKGELFDIFYIFRPPNGAPETRPRVRRFSDYPHFKQINGALQVYLH